MASKPPPARMPYGVTPTFQHHAPNAALLIDFDNVTMGIRSDLGKELKALLNSEVIRGKVAVQRAYADWRRYPQYIVPLAESSIDLIFAPAYGSAKKNATDLRMAIDAIELVFTRPEIGTFILMTGDSDFSSCVLKLKEYGKYVIGVGMRESSSDLLIQNCDEYYSYHSLSGLTRTGEDEGSREDPWTLVRRAAQQMFANGDVLRTDRLKQVMLDIDPGFDEKKVGYSKFSRFVQEASTKGLIKLRKGENGQYEIVADGAEDAPKAAEQPAPREEPKRGRSRDSEREDGRREGRGREPREPRPERVERVPEPTPSPAVAAPQAVQPEEVAPAPTGDIEPRGEPAMPSTPALVEAYGLLQEAVRSLASGGGRAVRDGDVKRKMLSFSPAFDETQLGFSKFTRFLRQAHDAEAIDLRRVNGGNYEVSLPASGKRIPMAEPRKGEVTAVGISAATEVTPAEARPPRQPERQEREPQAPRGRQDRPHDRAKPAEAPAPSVPQASVAAAATPVQAPRPTPPVVQPAAPVGALRGGRRSGRGGPLEGPPPILPGQIVGARPAPMAPAAPSPAEPIATAAVAEEAAPATGADYPTGAVRGRRGRGRKGAPVSEGAVVPPAQVAGPPANAGSAGAPPRGRPAKKSTAPEAGPRKGGRGGRGADAPRAASAKPVFSVSALGLPAGRSAVIEYLTSSYKGVGGKTAETLVDALGDDLFRVMEQGADRVRELLGDKRATALLDQWKDDYAARLANSRPTTQAPQVEAKSKNVAAATRAGGPARPRRGGRGGRPRPRPGGPPKS